MKPRKKKTARIAIRQGSDQNAASKRSGANKFKLSALGVVPKPGLSLAASTDAFAVDDDDDSCAHTPETMRREPAGLPDSSDNTAQPFYLTDAMINLTLLEQVTPGLQSIGGRPLSALITNTCFLEPYIYPRFTGVQSQIRSHVVACIFRTQSRTKNWPMI